MQANDYQKQAARTLIDGPGFELSDNEIMTMWCALGMAGESGEAIELIKKGILHRHGINKDDLKKEIGDVCWYISGICTVQGFDFGEILQLNIDKLKARYPNGWNEDDSKH